jgi:hypothetical protein
MWLALLAGCLESTPDVLSGPLAIEDPATLLVRCQTPSGRGAALGIIRGASCDGTPPRSCATWRELLRHPFACQPGAAIDPHAEAVVFWLDGDELAGAESHRIALHTCGAPPQPLLGEVRIAQGATPRMLHLDAEEMTGNTYFKLCH